MVAGIALRRDAHNGHAGVFDVFVHITYAARLCRSPWCEISNVEKEDRGPSLEQACERHPFAVLIRQLEGWG